MSSARAILAGLVVAASATIATSHAEAQYFGYNFAPAYNVYSFGRLPHYAQFPPVYYSHPVARPYGYSPYAYPGWVQTPNPSPIHTAPVIIQNPYASFSPQIVQNETTFVDGPKPSPMLAPPAPPTPAAPSGMTGPALRAN
jgi:hypothetical protein